MQFRNYRIRHFLKVKIYLVNKSIQNPEGEGDIQLFFGGCVPHGFPKVGSRDRIFLEKWGVLGTKIMKTCILRAEILAKTSLKTQFFF